jgi:hypothetical protein
MTWNIVNVAGHGIRYEHTAADLWTVLFRCYNTCVLSQTALVDRLLSKNQEIRSSLAASLCRSDRGMRWRRHQWSDYQTLPCVLLQLRDHLQTRMKLSYASCTMRHFGYPETKFHPEHEGQMTSPSSQHHPMYPLIRPKVVCTNRVHGLQGVHGNAMISCFSKGGGCKVSSPACRQKYKTSTIMSAISITDVTPIAGAFLSLRIGRGVVAVAFKFKLFCVVLLYTNITTRMTARANTGSSC